MPHNIITVTSLIFTAVEGEAVSLVETLKTGKKNVSDFLDLFRKSNSEKMEISLTKTLKDDIGHLKAFESELLKGTERGEAFSSTMSKASENAQKYAQSVDATTINIGQFKTEQEAAIQKTVAHTAATNGAVIAQKALAVALNIGLMIAITAVVQGIHLLTTAQERAIEKAEQLTGKYKDLQSELEALQSELKTTSERIDELNGKDHLTLTEQTELEKLKVANEQLKTQIELIEKLAKASKENAQKATIKVLEQQSERSHGENARYAGTNVRTDRFTAVDERIRELDALKATEKEIQNQLKTLDTSSRYWDIVNAKLSVNQTEQQKVKSYILETTDELLKQKDGLDATTEAGSEWIKKIDGLAVAVNQFFNEDFTGKFNEVFNAPNFDKAKKQIEDYAKSGELTADVLANKFPKVSKAFAENGISAEQAANHINASFEKVDATPIVEAIKSLSKSLDDLSHNTSLLAAVKKEISETGEVSFETVKKLEEAGYILSDILSVQNGRVVANTESMKAHNQSVLQDTITSYENSIAQKQKTIAVNESTIATKTLTVAMAERYGASQSEIDAIHNEIQALEEKNIALNKDIDDTQTSIDVVNAFANSSNRASDDIMSFVDKINTLGNAQKNLTQNKGIDSSSFKAVIDLYPEAIRYAKDYAGLQDFIAGKIVELGKTAVITYGQMVTADAESINMMLDNHGGLVNALIAYYGSDYQNFIKLSDGKYKADVEVVKRLSDLWAKYANTSAESIGRQLEFLARTGQTESEAYKEMRLYQQMFSSMSLEFKSFESTAVSAFNAVDESLKKSKDASKEYEQALKSAQSAINDLLAKTISMLEQEYADIKEGLQNTLNFLAERYNREKEHINDIHKRKKKANDDELKALKSQKSAVQDLISEYKEYINQKITALSQETDEYDYQKELAEKQKSVTDLQKQISSLGDSSTDDEATAKKRRELHAQLLEAQDKLEEFQYKKSKKREEDALKQALEEFTAVQNEKINQYDAEIEALNEKNDLLSEQHEQELKRVEDRYKANKAKLDKQIKDIDDYTKKEVNLRNEAIGLIEGRSDEFYDRLMAWSQEYTTYTKAEMQNTWDSAYTVLDAYDKKQIDVRATLDTLVTKMNSFSKETSTAASAMERLARASERANDAKAARASSGTFDAGGSGGYSKYHDGGIAGENSSQRHTGKLKSNEVPAILERDEIILSNKKSVSDVKNAVAYLEDALPANDTRALLAAFVSDAVSIQDLVNKPIGVNLNSSIASSMLSRNLPISPATKYEKIADIGGVNVDTIDCSLNVAGSIDKDVWPQVKREMNKMSKQFEKQLFDNWSLRKMAKGY